LKALEHQGQRETNLVMLGSVGTIAFGKINGLSYMYARAMGIGEVNNATDEFEMIDDAECVHEILRAVSAGKT
jgi:hypothetical protein